jgi:hypothetical protein
MESLRHINNHLGHVYNFPIRIGGFIVAAIGVGMTLTGAWGIAGGVVLIFVGLYFSFTTRGILIDLANKSVCHYTSYYGYRSGSWKEYPTYNHICIIRKEAKRKKFFEEPDPESESPYQFEINLVSRSFRGKVLLEICRDRETAEFRAKRFAEDMTASVAEYNPPSRTQKTNRGKHSGYKDHHNKHNDMDDL